jgi:hypothetical protein
MAVKKRPAPKRLTSPEKLVRWLLDPSSLPEIVKPYDVQRLEWLKAIAAERGILEPRRGLYEAAHDWLFELAYALAVEIHHGFRPGRRPASPIQSMAVINQVRKMRVKHPNESQRKIAARVLGISPIKISRKEYPANYRKIDAFCKRHMTAEKRRVKPFKK